MLFWIHLGTPLGCANQVLTGVEPNEHGTWLYGRNGWCDGRNVFPWVIDITQQVSLNKHNQISYFGWFNGTDPNPKQNPGMISLYSYLVYYRSWLWNVNYIYFYRKDFVDILCIFLIIKVQIFKANAKPTCCMSIKTMWHSLFTDIKILHSIRQFWK